MELLSRPIEPRRFLGGDGVDDEAGPQLNAGPDVAAGGDTQVEVLLPVGDRLVEVVIIGDLFRVHLLNNVFRHGRKGVELLVGKLGNVIEMAARHDPGFVIID